MTHDPRLIDLVDRTGHTAYYDLVNRYPDALERILADAANIAPALSPVQRRARKPRVSLGTPQRGKR